MPDSTFGFGDNFALVLSHSRAVSVALAIARAGQGFAIGESRSPRLFAMLYLWWSAETVESLTKTCAAKIRSAMRNMQSSRATYPKISTAHMASFVLYRARNASVQPKNATIIGVIL